MCWSSIASLPQSILYSCWYVSLHECLRIQAYNQLTEGISVIPVSLSATFCVWFSTESFLFVHITDGQLIEQICETVKNDQYCNVISSLYRNQAFMRDISNWFKDQIYIILYLLGKHAWNHHRWLINANCLWRVSLLLPALYPKAGMVSNHQHGRLSSVKLQYVTLSCVNGTDTLKFSH